MPRFWLLLLLVPVIGFAQESTVGIFWDVSFSAKERDLAKEFTFLEAYFKKVDNASVTLISFSNQVHTQDHFDIVSSDWSKIKERIKRFSYDGATSYESLAAYAPDGDILIFTDGRQNFREATPKFNGKVYIINVHKQFDRANLNLLAIVNDSDLVNLFGKNQQKNATKTYSGTIYRGTSGIAKASVYIKGLEPQVILSESTGNYKIEASEGDTLIVSFEDKKFEKVLEDQSRLDFVFGDEGVRLKEVVVTNGPSENENGVTTAFGVKNQDAVGYAVQSMDEKEISDIARVGADAIRGKFSGVGLGQNDDLSQVTLRPSNSILGNNYGLIVVDGVPIEQTRSGFRGLANRNDTSSDQNANTLPTLDDIQSTSFLNPKNIAKVTVLKGLAATNKYGSLGTNGVLLITTKTASFSSGTGKKKDLALLTDNIYQEKIKVDKKSLVTDYLKALKKGKNVQEAYALYLKQRSTYWNNPEYLIDVYDFFKASNPDLAERILSNGIEKASPVYEELRLVFLKASEQQKYDLALAAASKMVTSFPNKIQSYYDMAIAHRSMGNHQEALELLSGILKGTVNQKLNFRGLEKMADAEIRNLIHTESSNLDLEKIEAKYRNNRIYNARLVLDWNTPDAQFVVQFVNPQKRFFNWEHTDIGDKQRIVSEIRDGLTSEQFEIIGDGMKGDWLLNVTYLGNRTLGNTTPTFLKCKVQHNFGKATQRDEVYMIRLQDKEERELTRFRVD